MIIVIGFFDYKIPNISKCCYFLTLFMNINNFFDQNRVYKYPLVNNSLRFF